MVMVNKVYDRVVFLDADGVLNTSSTPIPKDGMPLDEVLVDRVVTLCAKCQAHVVISSSWRLNEEALEKLTLILMKKGVNIIGVTPNINPYKRTQEILQWLKSNQVGNYIILDDDLDLFQTDYKAISKHLVLTDDDTGFSEFDFDLAVKKLKSFVCYE